jgi:hypothetical protein
VAEQEPVICNRKVQKLFYTKRLVNLFVCPHRDAQQRNKKRRPVPPGYAVNKQASVWRRIRELVQHEAQVVLREHHEVPRAVVAPRDEVRRGRGVVEFQLHRVLALPPVEVQVVRHVLALVELLEEFDPWIRDGSNSKCCISFVHIHFL